MQSSNLYHLTIAAAPFYLHNDHSVLRQFVAVNSVDECLLRQRLATYGVQQKYYAATSQFKSRPTTTFRPQCPTARLLYISVFQLRHRSSTKHYVNYSMLMISVCLAAMQGQFKLLSYWDIQVLCAKYLQIARYFPRMARVCPCSHP